MAKFILSAFADEIDENFETQLSSLVKLKIPLIELRGVDGKSFTLLSDGEVGEVKEKLDRYGIKVWSLGSPVGKVTTDKFGETLKTLGRVMDIGDMLSAKRIRMFSFYPEQGDSPAAFEKKVFSLTEKLLSAADSRGFTLCHENEKGIYGQSPEAVKKLADYFGGKLRLVHDGGNFAFCGEEAAGSYALLKEYIEYLHIKDSVKSGAIVPPGLGDAAIKETLAEVHKDKTGEVVLTMEPHLMAFSGLSSLSNIDDITHLYTFDSPYDAFSKATQSVREMLIGIGAV